MLIRLLLAGFLLAHAAIHAAFVAPPPPATAGGPAWPFTTDDSWLLSRFGVDHETARLLATALFVVTLAGFGLAALVALGVTPAGLWLPAVTIGATASLGLLVVFFHPWLIAGVVIDLVLIAMGLIADWTPASLGTAD